ISTLAHGPAAREPLPGLAEVADVHGAAVQVAGASGREIEPPARLLRAVGFEDHTGDVEVGNERAQPGGRGERPHTAQIDDREKPGLPLGVRGGERRDGEPWTLKRAKRRPRTDGRSRHGAGAPSEPLTDPELVRRRP